MASDPLVARLQRALSPDYRVERELARGGMGIVFRAHDLMLDAPVAVKVIRPELATAHAAESFLREARSLARVRHPNIVAVYRAGEGEGLHYYVMELVEGQTLHERLEAGRLPRAQALKLGRDLLDGLEAVHEAGIVHRDVKPSNVFLHRGRALLADFGIARPSSEPVPRGRRTAAPQDGTPGYMAPEQLAGGAITPRTDLFAAGAVIYEAFTGRRLPPLAEGVSWEGVPRLVARVLERALKVHAQERWPDARSFRRALWNTRTRKYVRRTILLTVAGLVAGGSIAFLPVVWRPGAGPGGVAVAVPDFDFTGPPPQRWIADSLVHHVRWELRGHPDFHVTAGGRAFPWARPAVVVQGEVSMAGTEVRARLADRRATGGVGFAVSEVRAPMDQWRALVDSLTHGIVLAVWDSTSPLAASLPRRALPHTTLGLARFIEAERLVAAARWEPAYRAYLLAESTDSTCLVCSWRVNDVGRWLGKLPDSARARRYLAHLDYFPAPYASLVRAGHLPLVQRLDTLRGVTERFGDFFLGWFQSGDELFHRGPLAGHPRAEAITDFETAVRLRPDFGPAWEHLAWVLIAEGDSAGAARALDSLNRRHPAPDAYSLALRSLLDLGFAWRFLPHDAAEARTRRVLESPVARASPDLGAGPRLLPSFDAPRGAVAMGRLLEAGDSRALKRSGLIAQVLGSVAVGEPERARELARRLMDVSPEIDVALFAAELDGALALLDGESEPAETCRAYQAVVRHWGGTRVGATYGARADTARSRMRELGCRESRR